MSNPKFKGLMLIPCKEGGFRMANTGIRIGSKWHGKRPLQKQLRDFYGAPVETQPKSKPLPKKTNIWVPHGKFSGMRLIGNAVCLYDGYRVRWERVCVPEIHGLSPLAEALGVAGKSFEKFEEAVIGVVASVGVDLDSLADEQVLVVDEELHKGATWIDPTKEDYEDTNWKNPIDPELQAKADKIAVQNGFLEQTESRIPHSKKCECAFCEDKRTARQLAKNEELAKKAAKAVSDTVTTSNVRPEAVLQAFMMNDVPFQVKEVEGKRGDPIGRVTAVDFATDPPTIGIVSSVVDGVLSIDNSKAVLLSDQMPVGTGIEAYHERMPEENPNKKTPFWRKYATPLEQKPHSKTCICTACHQRRVIMSEGVIARHCSCSFCADVRKNGLPRPKNSGVPHT